MLLTLLTLAVPLPALALSGQSMEAVAERGPAAISVSAALDSCGTMDGGVVCKINVAYTQIPGATSYSATVTAAGGFVTDYGTVNANATTLYVPYTGNGGYSVRITAYGAPEEPSDEGDNEAGEVIATGIARPDDHDARPRIAPERKNEAEATGRDATTATIEGSGGQLQAETATQATETPAPVCEPPPVPVPAPEPPPLPEPPPADLDPENLDEDADGVTDAEETAAYDRAVAAQEAAAAQPPAPAPAPAGC